MAMFRFITSASRAACAAIGVAALVSCDSSPGSEPTSPNGKPESILALEQRAEVFGTDPGFFTPLPASASCTAGGTFEQIVLPTGFVSTLIESEPDYPDLPDMNTLNETGQGAGRYLYRTHEVGSNGSVTVTDLVTGKTKIVAQRADWERFDGIAWTRWGTILAAEETIISAIKDPLLPAAVGGHVYEIDPVTGAATLRDAIGARSHEGLRFDVQGNLYGISEKNPGYIYKFTPDKRGDLSSGQLYALQIVTDLGDRTGWARWLPLDRSKVRLDSDAEAAAASATGYARPEDVETGVSTGNDGRGNRMLYVAITSEHRVLAIDLNPPGAPQPEQVKVTDYVRAGVNAPVDFQSPDNLALDKWGNLYIAEDVGGNFPTKTLGDDVWVGIFDPSNAASASSTERFFSITDCDAEPTGIYFSRSGRSLFVNIQHRGGDGRDATYAIQKISPTNFRTTAPTN